MKELALRWWLEKKVSYNYVFLFKLNLAKNFQKIKLKSKQNIWL